MYILRKKNNIINILSCLSTSQVKINIEDLNNLIANVNLYKPTTNNDPIYLSTIIKMAPGLRANIIKEYRLDIKAQQIFMILKDAAIHNNNHPS